jgi:hypothetical protein
MEKLVECYSGTAYAERPVALSWEGTRLEVSEVLNSWQTPAGKAFRVCTTDGRAFELAYDEFADRWSVELAGQDPG